ncbi:hypothetical protein CONLIGDRAFT_675175 [Coniochaeta ligniaria NRRL 30616]|uniref:Uncharacterized protein n=1 Tax=Coniochaeta ligniaria NRRL 30616 TaxID=1408157 RepID=A0A1J7IX83_9PEZI|nr:hypothetical protein CONLIGDRAFT_675175 [Coniochaeta ligniaria NRRL 30616]
MDSLMEMMRTQMGQNQQLATQVAQLAAQSPRREPSLQPSHRRDPPAPADEDDDFEMIGHHQLPRRDREMTSHRNIKPETGRRSFAPFAQLAGSSLPTHTTARQSLHSSPCFITLVSSEATSASSIQLIQTQMILPWSLTASRSFLPMPNSTQFKILTELLIHTNTLNPLDSITDKSHTANSICLHGKSQLARLSFAEGHKMANSELATQDRRQLRYGELPAVLEALRQRFRQDPAIASAKLTQGRLSLSDLADYDGDPDLNQLTTFIQKKLRYARQMGILDDNTSHTGHTWHDVIIQIHSQMDLQIRKYLPAPRTEDSLAAYLATVEASKSILAAAVRDRQVAQQRSRRRGDDYNGGDIGMEAGTAMEDEMGASAPPPRSSTTLAPIGTVATGADDIQPLDPKTIPNTDYSTAAESSIDEPSRRPYQCRFCRAVFNTRSARKRAHYGKGQTATKEKAAMKDVVASLIQPQIVNDQHGCHTRHKRQASDSAINTAVQCAQGPGSREGRELPCRKPAHISHGELSEHVAARRQLRPAEAVVQPDGLCPAADQALLPRLYDEGAQQQPHGEPLARNSQQTLLMANVLAHSPCQEHGEPPERVAKALEAVLKKEMDAHQAAERKWNAMKSSDVREFLRSGRIANDFFQQFEGESEEELGVEEKTTPVSSY